MRIYFAAPYACRDELRGFATELTDAGHEITSHWLDAKHEIGPGTLGDALAHDGDYCRKETTEDLEDVLRSDVVILFTWQYCKEILSDDPGGMGPNSGGRHVETGAALVSQIDVLVIGKPENVFHRGLCTVVASWAEAREELKTLHNKRFGIPTLVTATETD